MGSFVKPSEPKVANPVNPLEDFADKWANEPRLEENFWKWINRIQEDLKFLSRSTDVDQLSETIFKSFDVPISASKLKMHQGLMLKAAAITSGVARTNSYGVIGNNGVSNRDHKFYG